MLRSLRHHFGIGRRSRRSVIAVAWLCFLVATLPCLSMAAGACCPTIHDDTEAQTSPGHSPATPAPGDRPDDSPPTAAGGHPCDPDPVATPAGPSVDADALAEGCPVLTADGCCEAPVPTLEDRSPKVPAKLAETVPAPALLLIDSAVTTASTTLPATGPPPGLWDASPVHLELCTFLI